MTALRPSVRLRLTVMYGVVFLLAGAVLLAVNYGLVRSRLPADDLVFERAVRVEGAMQGGVTAVGPGERPEPGGIVVLPDGRSIPVPDDAVTGAGGFFFLNGIPMTSTFLEDFPTQTRDRALRELVTQSLLALGLMAVVSVGLGWWMAGRALRPLHHIISTAKHLSEHDLHRRIDLEGPGDELKELADTFDAMLARLELAFESQKRFAANASHQLRTPLAIMRTEVDVTMADPDAGMDEYRRMAERVGGAIERSEEMVASLLLLAHSDRALERHDPADLAASAELAVASQRRAMEAAGLSLQLMCDPAPVVGDPGLLDHAVLNLVENAIVHNQAGGWVHVTTGVVDAESFVRVANSGPVVPPDEVEGLFEPFRRQRGRLDGASGSGLGLSIVRSVATAHGGRVSARAFANGGLEVTVWLARQEPASV